MSPSCLTHCAAVAVRSNDRPRTPLGRVVDRPCDGPVTVHIPATTLTVVVDGEAVTVRGGDGAEIRPQGPWRGPIDRLRVRRRGDRYAIEMRSGEGVSWHVEVDRAAVRTDDSIAVRLERRLPPWGLPALGVAFALSAVLLV